MLCRNEVREIVPIRDNEVRELAELNETEQIFALPFKPRILQGFLLLRFGKLSDLFWGFVFPPFISILLFQTVSDQTSYESRGVKSRGVRSCISVRQYKTPFIRPHLSVGKPRDKASDDYGRNPLRAGAILARGCVPGAIRLRGKLGHLSCVAKIVTAQRVFHYVTGSENLLCAGLPPLPRWSMIGTWQPAGPTATPAPPESQGAQA